MVTARNLFVCLIVSCSGWAFAEQVQITSPLPLPVSGTFTPPALTTVTFNGTAQPVTSTSNYITNIPTVTFNGTSQPVYLTQISTVTFNGIAQPVTSTYTVISATYAIPVSGTFNPPALTTVTFNGTAQQVTSTYTVISATYSIPVSATFNPPALTTVTFNGAGQPVTSTSTIVQQSTVGVVNGGSNFTAYNYTQNVTTVTHNGVAQQVTSTSTYITNTATVTFNGVGQPTTSTSTYVVNPTTTVFLTAQPVTSTYTVISATSSLPVFGGVSASQTAAWTSATALDTTLSLVTTGYGSVVVSFILSGTITGGNLYFESSVDGSTWFTHIVARMDGASTLTQYSLNGNSSAAWQTNVAGMNNFRVRLNPAITGTGTANMKITGYGLPSVFSPQVLQGNGDNLRVRLQDSIGNLMQLTGAGALTVSVVNTTTATFNGIAQQVTSTSTIVQQSTVGVVGVGKYDVTGSTVGAPALTKGTQGTNGWSTQDLKDAGRTFVVLVATAVAGVTSEALFSFTQNKGGVVTNAVGSYTITSGKTLRIQGLYCSNRDGTTAVSFTKAVLRSNFSGATVANSAMIFGLEIGDQAALAGAGSDFEAPFPDGIEIAGDGTKTIGVSHLDQATSNLVSCTLVGYEY